MFEDAILGSYCLHLFNQCKFSVMHFIPIFNKILLKFPIPWGWVMFPKSWEKILASVLAA
jgi:hypothetical protein